MQHKKTMTYDMFSVGSEITGNPAIILGKAGHQSRAFLIGDCSGGMTLYVVLEDILDKEIKEFSKKITIYAGLLDKFAMLHFDFGNAMSFDIPVLGTNFEQISEKELVGNALVMILVDSSKLQKKFICCGLRAVGLSSEITNVIQEGIEKSYKTSTKEVFMEIEKYFRDTKSGDHSKLTIKQAFNREDNENETK